MNHFDGCVLSGGGIRGIGELGILHYYIEKEYFVPEKIKVYAGTSIGSVISLLLICGYIPTEIFAKAYTLTDIIPFPSLTEIYNGIKNYGITDIDSLIKIVEDMVFDKMKKIPTLKELYEITKKVLVVSVGNVTKCKGEYYSYINKPDLICTDAIKMSCNLPFIFKRIDHNGDNIIDGGFTDNFPIDLPEFRGCSNILGVAILSKGFFSQENGLKGFFSHIYNILSMIIMGSLIKKLKKLENTNSKLSLIRLNFEGASILEFGASSEKKMSMFLSGYEEAKIYDSTEYLMIEGWGEEDDWGEW